jgi:hypothetical protein
MRGTFHTLEWVRIFADSVFLTLGVAPILMAALRSLAKRDAPVSGSGPHVRFRIYGGQRLGRAALIVFLT